MKVVVPMAGRGSRFAQTGVTIPKPLIEVAGRPMVAWALDSLRDVSCSEIIFVALAEHERQYGVTARLRRLADAHCHVLLLDEVTEGQLCTVLAARELIEGEEDLLIASADTLVVSQLGRDIQQRKPEVRGIISVADMPGDRWSFARTNEAGHVLEVAEKVRISDHASTGLYYFASGRQFVTVADEMVAGRETTGGEYYVIPVYQKYLARGWQIVISVADEMWDMGTPEAAARFRRHLEAAGKA